MSFVADPGQATGGMTASGLGNAVTAVGAGSFADAEALKQTAVESGKLVEAAKNGGFKVDPAVVKDMITSIEDMQHELSDLRSSTTLLSQAPQLGAHDYGHQVSKHDQAGADTHPASATNAMSKFEQVLRDTREALKRASDTFTAQDEAAAQSARKYQA